MHHSYPTPIPQHTFLNSYGPPGMANQDSTYPLSPSSANAKFGTTCNRYGDATSIIHSKIFVNSIFLLIIRLSKYEPECHVDFSILLAKEEIVLMTNSIVSDTGFPGLRFQFSLNRLSQFPLTSQHQNIPPLLLFICSFPHTLSCI